MISRAYGNPAHHKKSDFKACDQVRHKPACSATQTGKNTEIFAGSKFRYHTFQRDNNKGTDKTVHMCRLICRFFPMQLYQVSLRRGPSFLILEKSFIIECKG